MTINHLTTGFKVTPRMVCIKHTSDNTYVKHNIAIMNHSLSKIIDNL